MAALRRALNLITAVWLVTESVLLISPSVALLAASESENAAECTCTHDGNTMCPMHHRTPAGSKVCLIGGVDDGLAMLGSLFQAAGLMPVATNTTLTLNVPVAINPDAAVTLRSAPPDSPPPRA